MALVGADFRLSGGERGLLPASPATRAESCASCTFADITHPDDVDTDLRLARRVFAGEVSGYSIDKRYVRKDGEAVWAELSVFLIRDESGAPVQGMGLVQDISDRHAALDKARTELARLARDHDRILEFAGEGIYYVDARGRIAFANPAAARDAGLGARTRWWASRRTRSSTTRAPTASRTRARAARSTGRRGQSGRARR